MMDSLKKTWSENLKSKKPLVRVTRTWNLYCVTPKLVDYMQDNTMLLEQCDHILVKALDTVTQMHEDQI